MCNLYGNQRMDKVGYGLKVSSLCVAQIKDKCGIEKRLNYNVGDNKSRVPNARRRKKKRLWQHLSILV